MPEAITPRPLVPSSPHPRLLFTIGRSNRRNGSEVSSKSLSATSMEGRRVSVFRTLSSRAVRLNPYTASRRQHGCAERHHPSSPTPQLPTAFDDRQTDRPTDPPTSRQIKPTTRFGSSRHVSATHLRRRTELGLTALIGVLFLISPRLGQQGQVAELQPSPLCFFRPD
jgi:hypothetical protein